MLVHTLYIHEARKAVTGTHVGYLSVQVTIHRVARPRGSSYSHNIHVACETRPMLVAVVISEGTWSMYVRSSWLQKLPDNSTGPAGNERDIKFMTPGSYILVHHMWPVVYYLSAIT
jgi:hypothetical protein